MTAGKRIPPQEKRLRAALEALARPGARLIAVDAAGHVTGAGGRAVLAVPAETVALLRRSGLVRAEGAAEVLSPEGEARRARTAHPLGFAAQHTEFERVRPDAEACIEVYRDTRESPLVWLRSRKGPDGRPLLDDAQFAAGERLRADVTRAALLPRTGANWEAGVATGRRADAAADFTDGTIAARTRVNLALAAIGPELSGVVLDVCAFLKGLEQVERERAWPPRSGRIVLGLGLDRLARHYGLGAVATGPDRARLSAWRGEGTRDLPAEAAE